MASVYARMAAAAPKRTNFATGATVMGVGDAVVQLRIESQPLDSRRLLVCSSFNALLSIPLALWYASLDRRWPGTALASMVPKVPTHVAPIR